MDISKTVSRKGMVVKLYDPNRCPEVERGRNVKAFSASGEHLWTIEPLEEAIHDVYTDVWFDGATLRVFNFQCYNCVVSKRTGKILSSQFTK